MMFRSRFTHVVLTASLLLFLVASTALAVVYVKSDSPGSGSPPTYDGGSWDTAYHSIQQGLDDADVTKEQVWVARGTYVERITLKSGVALYGGFQGTESALAERPPFSRTGPDPNEAIIDGNNGGSSVVTPEFGNNVLIDGFTIRNGRATSGGGIFCNGYSPTISHNKIIQNTTTSNDQYFGGGGIYIDGNSSPTISWNVISNNSSPRGAGIFCADASRPIISNNVISHNTSSYRGGGIYARDATANVHNNLIVDNQAVEGGGVLWFGGSLSLQNNTIAGNGGYGAVYCSWCWGGRMENNIVALNQSGVYKDSYANVFAFNHNCIYGNSWFNYEGLSPSLGDIDADPCFVAMASGDYHLKTTPQSPCIDAGSDGIVLPSWLDIDGQARTVGTHVDIGADECDRVLTPTLSPETGVYDAPVLVTVDCPTPDATLHYTRTGVDPTEQDPQVSAGSALFVASTQVLKVRAWKTGWSASDVASGSYTVNTETSINQVKRRANDSVVVITDAVVTAVFSSIFYLEADDRACGIAVYKSGHGLQVGMRADAEGTLKTNTHGEKYIQALSATQDGNGSVDPLFLINRGVGGGDWAYNAVNGEGQKGVKDSVQLNNIGLLVSVTGEIEFVGTGYFYVADGFRGDDGSGHLGLKVVGTAPGGANSIGKQVNVTGISTCFKSGSDLYPQVRATVVELRE